MLCDGDFISSVPEINNKAQVPLAYLNRLLKAADDSIKSYCKQNLEVFNYQEPADGTEQVDLVLAQCPVWQAQTSLASTSSGITPPVTQNGLSLPQSTIYVNSVGGFPPGTFKNPGLLPPCLTIQVGLSKYTSVTYTGLDTVNNAFTGCSGGAGVLTTNNRVFTPCIWVDPQGFGGQNPTSFGDGTLVVQGSDYEVRVDNSRGTQNRVFRNQSGLSRKGLVRRIAGSGGGSGSFINFFPDSLYRGKLASFRRPTWPAGSGNIKICYTAGYYPIPHDLRYACAILVAQMVRILPKGVNLSSESLGGYTYSALYNGTDPEMGEIRRVLASYREVSW